MQDNQFDGKGLTYSQSPVRKALQDEVDRTFEVLINSGERISRLPKDHPAIAQFAAAWKALGRHDFGPPMQRVYSVAAFASPSRSWLQELGRAVYYSKPSRYHVLLPLLGTVSACRPGAKRPGWFLLPVNAA